MVPPVPAPDHDPGRHGMLLLRHLLEDRLGDVVVAAPVGGALGIRELVHVVAAELARPGAAPRHTFRRAVDEMAFAAIEGDLRDLFGRGRARHHREKRSPASGRSTPPRPRSIRWMPR